MHGPQTPWLGQGSLATAAKVATETLEVATQPVTLGVLLVDVAEEAPLGETEVVPVVDVAVQAGETVEEAAAVGFNNTKSNR